MYYLKGLGVDLGVVSVIEIAQKLPRLLTISGPTCGGLGEFLAI